MSFARVVRSESVRTGAEDGIEVGVLGPLVLAFDGHVHTPTAPKLRNVLTTLVLNADKVVPVSLLMRELWEDEPPASWLTTLQTYILNLRKLLARAAGVPTAEISRTLLVTKAGAYLFKLGAGNLDLHRYQALVSSGREFLAAGDCEQAAHTLDAALRVWRGPAFLDVQGGRLLESRRRQIEESRLVVLEQLVDARLRLGQYHEVLTELMALTVENPMHEGLFAQHMLALYCLGRRAEALAVYRRLRGSLIEELGLEPGPRARQVHQAMLDGDSAAVDRLLRSGGSDTRWAMAEQSTRAY
ncbi:AfsR/SARP family transcriptional regulator [Actinokineospora sp.]|uniref:AfsR/SARP family transcriptional regulator n=1 Tax=Actinokineospora sp. TaxID=1872133 RepID=UPI004037C5FE